MSNNIDKSEEKLKDKASSFALTAVCFISAWIIQLSPQTILNFYPEIVSRLLLAGGFIGSSILFDNKSEDKNTGISSDLSIGLGLLIIFISFVNSDYHWNIYMGIRVLYKIFIWFIGVMGIFGTFSGIYKSFDKVAIAGDQKRRKEENNFYQRLLDLFLKILQVIIAIYTILEFSGIT